MIAIGSHFYVFVNFVKAFQGFYLIEYANFTMDGSIKLIIWFFSPKKEKYMIAINKGLSKLIKPPNSKAMDEWVILFWSLIVLMSNKHLHQNI